LNCSIISSPVFSLSFFSLFFPFFSFVFSSVFAIQFPFCLIFSISLPLTPSNYLAIYISIYMLFCQHTYIYQSVLILLNNLFIFTPFFLSIHRSNYFSINLSIHLFIYISTYLSTYLSQRQVIQVAVLFCFHHRVCCFRIVEAETE